MQDIASLPWDKSVLDVVATVTTETKQKTKLRARLADYNKTVDRSASPPALSAARGLAQKPLFPPLSRTAVTLKKPAKTRFASIESTLEAFIRTRPVLRHVVDAPDFYSNLWEAQSLTERAKRVRFVSTVDSSSFVSQVDGLHKVFRLLRRYLREFHSDDGMISDVLPKTIDVGLALEKVPVTAFLTGERKAEVLQKFYKRRDGPLGNSIRVRLLDDIHFAAHLLDPYRSTKDTGPFLPRFRAFLARYCMHACTTSTERHRDSRELNDGNEELREKLLHQFIEISTSWDHQKQDPEKPAIFRDFRSIPLQFWRSYVDRNKYRELVEFAARTLPISPSSCAAERSFSMQDRIRTKSRNRLHTYKVQKLAFTHWNLKLFENEALEKESFYQSVRNEEEREAYGEEKEDEDNEVVSNEEGDEDLEVIDCCDSLDEADFGEICSRDDHRA